MSLRFLLSAGGLFLALAQGVATQKSVPQIANEEGFFGPQPATHSLGARSVSRYITEVHLYYGDTICNGTATGGSASVYNFALSDDEASAKTAFDAFLKLGSGYNYTFPGNLSVPASPTSDFVCGANNQGFVQSVRARYYEATLETSRSDFFENFTSVALSNITTLQSQQQFFAIDLFGANSTCSRAKFYYRSFYVLEQCRRIQYVTSNGTLSTASIVRKSSDGLSVLFYWYNNSTSCGGAASSNTSYNPLNTCIANNYRDTAYSVLTLPNLTSVAASNFPSPSVAPSTSSSPSSTPAAPSSSPNVTSDPVGSGTTDTPMNVFYFVGLSVLSLAFAL